MPKSLGGAKDVWVPTYPCGLFGDPRLFTSEVLHTGAEARYVPVEKKSKLCTRPAAPNLSLTQGKLEGRFPPCPKSVPIEVV